MLAQSTLLLALASSLSLAHARADHPQPRLHARQETSVATQTSAATRTTAAASTVTAMASATKKENAAAGSPLPLTQYTFAYDEVPYQVNPYAVERGPQIGYNQCNETTKGDDSLCQTLVANDLADFCLWGSQTNSSDLETIGDIEAATVAYCTSDNHGARLLKSGALKGVQVLRTEYYIQWTGVIDQTALHIQADDTGGELDPHGADLMGNPLGGLVYSTNLPPSGDNKTFVQAIEWNQFVGSGSFCLKLCAEKQPDGINYCENTYDRMGCLYNAPAAYKEGEFSDCDSELQDRVGIYTGTDGKVSTYSQPPEGTAPNPPYQPRVPSTSNCKTYASTALYTAGATTAASSASASGSKSASASGSSSGSAAGAQQTGSGGDNAARPSTGLVAASTGLLALVAGAFAVLA
ncbi:hypothetical protein JCM10207_006425 [Rhodosporidiobolus poonsookiae]